MPFCLFWCKFSRCKDELGYLDVRNLKRCNYILLCCPSRQCEDSSYHFTQSPWVRFQLEVPRAWNMTFSSSSVQWVGPILVRDWCPNCNSRVSLIVLFKLQVKECLNLCLFLLDQFYTEINRSRTKRVLHRAIKMCKHVYFNVCTQKKTHKKTSSSKVALILGEVAQIYRLIKVNW